MRSRVVGYSAVAVLGLSTTISALAHHSQSEFDSRTSVEVNGTVTELVWKSPHAWIYMDVVSEDGEVVNWGFELPSPTTLMRRGWSRKSLTPGDVITVTGAPARNHPGIGLARTVRDAAGNGVFTGITEVNEAEPASGTGSD
jgi:Family of unknown function (DUF6152)